MTLKFIEYWVDIDDIYKNIEEDNPNKKRKILYIFDDVIVNMLSNKNLNPAETKFFIRDRKLNIALVSITQLYLNFRKNIKINSTHYFIMNISNKQGLTFNHSSDIDFKNFMNLYKKSTAKPRSFLVIDSTFTSQKSSSFRNTFLEMIYKLIMRTDDNMRDEKLQYENNRKAAKISPLL